MKQTYKLKVFLLLAFFSLLGGGNILAQTQIFYESFDKVSGTGGNDGSFSGSVAQSNFSASDCDNTGWTATKGYAASKCIKLGTGSAQGSATTPTITLESGKTYTLSFVAAAWNGNSEQTTLNLSSTAGTLSESTITLKKGEMQTYTLTLIGTGEGTITFQGKQAKNSRFFLDEVKVTLEDGIPSKTVTTLSFAESSYSLKAGTEEATSFSGQTATLTDTDGNAVSGTVTYASSNTALATVDETTGAVSLVSNAYGTTTITATYAGDDTHAGATASYTITVSPSLTGDGTVDNPYTVSDINALFVTGETPSNVYIKGFISQIKEVSTTYGNANYYISDDAETDNQLYVYRGLYLEQDKFTSADQIAVGDEVIVYGSLTTYNNVLQVAANNYLYYLKHTEATIEEMTASQAIAELDKEDYTKNVVNITGIISQIKEISTSYGNATYYISDDGTTGNQLMVYRGTGLEGAKFTSTSDLHVGDKVQVQGYLTIYNNTKEVSSNSTILSLDCPHVEVAVSAAGYASLYYGTTALTVPEGVEAYTYTVSDGKLSESYMYEANEVIPAATGVILKADAGSYLFTKTEAEGEKDTDNLLKGSDEEELTTGGDVYYQLSLNAAEEEGSIGFYYGADNGAAFTNGAHKAYLPLTAAQAAGTLAFRFDGTIVSSIGNIGTSAATTSNAIYDLQGRRVQSLHKGIYIVNGKKLIK